MKQGSFTSRDGTLLAWQRIGSGPDIVIANGLGGSIPAWKHVIAALSDRFTITAWDYRGLFSSHRPADLSSVTVPVQADDLEDLLALFHIEKAIFMGWSYGGQVLVELYRRRPEAFSGLVLLNAMVGPASGSLRLPQLCAPIFSHLLTFWAPFWRLAAPLADRVIRSGAVVSFIKSTGLVGPDLDEDVFREIAEKFVNMDHEVFRATLESAERYDGRDVLPLLRIPVLIIAGTRDFIVLPQTTREIARAIPGSRLVFVPRTSHYTAVERPAEVASEVVSFLNSLES
ncbi:alpha/beta hydrolase [Myxococcota bacterium]|nr:alpha/beta hydrolase [Myxococcota bacterium]